MNYTETLQEILKYIDDHLNDKLDADILASKAHLSTYHFCRIFRFNVGYSVMGYVRHRRLQFAACELSKGKKIIDIALDYGFETHSGFSKAFRRHFGCPPESYVIHSQSKQPSLPLLYHVKKYSSGGIVMEPKFVTLPAIKIAGYAIKTTSNGNENSTDIPKFWGAYMSDGRMEKLHKESFIKKHAEYGVCFLMDPDTGEFDYAIGVEVSEEDNIPDEYYINTLPAATYAIFTTPPSNAEEFSAKIQGTWQFIFNEWFQKSGYEYAEGAVDFELYDERCMNETGKVCDIYIPVKKKEK